jgi:signal transduction histidine kinase
VNRLQRALVQTEQGRLELARANRELDERVSERTRLLQASVAELEAFGHDVAHTLRAPLRAIEGMVGIVLDDHANRLPDSAREQLRRISDSAHTMDATVVALLEYNRLGHQRVALEPVRVREVVEGAVTEAWRRRGGPSDRFVIEGPSAARARANRMLLERAVLEVASNPLVHRPPGGFANVRVRIEAAGPRVRITFADRGPGIDARHQARIFGLFERLHSDAAMGLGSGLAIARRAVERMGGTIGLMSEPGAGSTFWIDLPVASEDDVRLADAVAGPPIADGSIEARVRRLARRVVSAATPRSR